MRHRGGLIAIVGLLGAACSGSGRECGTSAPRLTCVAGGLAGVDLAGTWTLTGTATTNHYDPPGPSSTAPVTTTITITVDGCAFDVGTATPLAGMLDDTNAIETVTSGDEHGDVVICAEADGTIHYDATLGWDRRARGGDNGSTETTGTLAR